MTPNDQNELERDLRTKVEGEKGIELIEAIRELERLAAYLNEEQRSALQAALNNILNYSTTTGESGTAAERIGAALEILQGNRAQLTPEHKAKLLVLGGGTSFRQADIAECSEDGERVQLLMRESRGAGYTSMSLTLRPFEALNYAARISAIAYSLLNRQS